MSLDRRQFLTFSLYGAGMVASWRAWAPGIPQSSGETERRISRVVEEYSAQGDHRTGTPVDTASGQWLASHVRALGLPAELEQFRVDRITPLNVSVSSDGHRTVGIPLFDGGFSGPEGVGGRIGPLGSEHPIGFTTLATNTVGAGAIAAARLANQHRAIVAVTRGGTPGLTPSNADRFLTPFGPSVVQVASTEMEWLADAVARGLEVRVVAQVQRAPTYAVNVTSVVEGRSAELPPLVIMTPRSGWYACASERGGGIACWLELLRTVRDAKSSRSVLFVASTGHELGHLGIDHFIERRQGIVRRAVAWLHLGSSIGAAIEPRYRLQASDDELEESLSTRLASVGMPVTLRTPRGNVPAGEAEAVHHGGGRFVSVVGGSARFHHPDDRWPDAVSPAAVAKFAEALGSLARKLAV